MQGGTQPIIIHTAPVAAGQTQQIQVRSVLKTESVISELIKHLQLQVSQQQQPHPVYLTHVLSPEGETTS